MYMTETTFKSKKLEDIKLKSKKIDTDTRVLTIRVESEFYRELEQQAARLNISLDDYINKVLTESVEQSKLK
jgi:predicted HicB family RNase H-like nuclease